MTTSQPSYWIGADIGGTFTDLFVIDRASGARTTGKILTDQGGSDQQHYRRIEATAERDAVDLKLAERAYGTTLVTNAVLQRRGARTALLVTEGFRDSVGIGTEHRFDLYDLNLRKAGAACSAPVAKAGGGREFWLTERSSASWTERRSRPRFAISWRRASMPSRSACCIRIAMPVTSVSCATLSARSLPKFTCRCRPISGQRSANMNADQPFHQCLCRADRAPYLRSLGQRLEQMGIPAQLLIMQSNEASARRKLRKSGTRFGSSNLVRRRRDRRRLHCADGQTGQRALFDMGGTTAKAFIIDDARPPLARKLEVAQVYRFKHGSGLPVQTPALEMH